MNARKIDLLERFGTCSEIIQFYGYAFKAFLLLTKLNKKTREMLDQNYDGIINCLLETRSLIQLLTKINYT